MDSLQFQSDERAEVATSSQGSWLVEGWNGLSAVLGGKGSDLWRDGMG